MTLIVANWKLNGDHASVGTWCKGVTEKLAAEPHPDKKRELCVCPPYVLIPEFRKQLAESPGTLSIGAQDVSGYEGGAHTGEVSAAMLKELSCGYVIIGHSERREQFGEGNEILARKLANLVAQNITPIFCVGESEAEQQAGKTEQVLQDQLGPVMDVLATADAGKVPVIAYEPVWAIGTGKAATPEIATEVHGFIRQQLPENLRGQVKILYGGSVKPDNAKGYLNSPEIDGLLVGGASLDATSITDIFFAGT